MSWTISPKYKDPDYSNVSLLLHGNGTNGSTTITDNSPTPKTVTAVGNAQISTAQSKFGGASIAFDGIGDYLTLDGSAAFLFGTGDFTIETWFRPSNLTGLKIIVDTRPTGTISVASHWAIATDGATLNYAVAGSSYTGGALSLNTWHFLALSRASGSTRAFLDGVQIGSTVTDTTNYLIGASRPIIGADGNSPISVNFNGYIDDLRITKGVARYTANFTPPAAPFADI